MVNYYRLHECSLKELSTLKEEKQKEIDSLKDKVEESKERNYEISQIKIAIEKKEQEKLERNFTLKDEHIKLLKQTKFKYIDFGDVVKFGVDGKRPFGNSDYYNHMVEILDLEWEEDEDGQYKDWQYRKLEKLLRELPLAVNYIIKKITMEKI